MWLPQKNPWSTGLGDFVLNDMLFVLVAKPCQTLCEPMDCSQPGSSVHVISQARTPEWVAISYSRGSSQPRGQICVCYISCIARGFFTSWATGASIESCNYHSKQITELFHQYSSLLLHFCLWTPSTFSPVPWQPICFHSCVISRTLYK